MHAIRVIPENAEVVCGAGHLREATHRFVGIRDAGGVGVLGHAPHAFDGVVFGDKSLDLIHVGTVFVHRDGNHFDAVALGDAKVAIVSGHGAEPLYLRKLAPRGAAQIAVRVSCGNQVEHDVEARIAEHAHVGGVVLHDFAHQALRFHDAVHDAIVTAIGTIFSKQIGRRGELIEHGQAQCQLVASRLATCHVQRKPLRAVARVFGFEGRFQRFELAGGHIDV